MGFARKPLFSCLIVNVLRRRLTSTLALVAIYSYLALICISGTMKIFDNDYVTLTQFSRSFEYIIFNTGF